MIFRRARVARALHPEASTAPPGPARAGCRGRSAGVQGKTDMGRLARILAAWTLVLLAAAPAARASEREGMRVHIIHGYAASPADHWFPWLERELERRGARVDIVELPASDAPRPEAWLQALEVQVGRPDRNTFFVAHSLGGITLLRYLESLQPEPEV